MAERRQAPRRRDQLRPLMPLAALWLGACCLLVAMVLQNQVPYEDLLLDPTYASGLPWYMGMVSNLGVLGWTAAAVSGGLGSWTAQMANRRGAAMMLAGGSLLTVLLLFDDLFQLHVLVKPLLGLPKWSAYLVYGSAAMFWVGTQAVEIRRTRYGLLVAAATAFAVSLLLDQLAPAFDLSARGALVAEDSAKFFGILAWAQYFVLTSVDIVRSILNQLANQSQKTPVDEPQRVKVGLGHQ